jgi:DNA modification methylase
MNYQLHLGDCLEFMKGLPDGSIDAVVTDPPYGINQNNSGKAAERGGGWRDMRHHGDWDTTRPQREVFDEMQRVGKRLIVWGGNYFTDYLPPTQQWLVWDKGQRDFSLADCEFAWSSQNQAARIFLFHRGAMSLERVEHPTQKPLALMRWCIELLKMRKGSTILDPYMGSGTTGAAAMQLGYDFIGCEKYEPYFAIAQRRIEDAAAQLHLFPQEAL